MRGFFPDVLDAIRCHQDLQIAGHGASLMRAYVAKYVSKFSDAAQEEWLNDSLSASQLAKTVAQRYRPMEPETVLQLCGGRFRQWGLSTVSGGKRNFLVPVPGEDYKPQEISLYESARWAAGKISLLDFLRKSNAKGGIIKFIKDAWRSSAQDCTLEEFAAAYKMRGEKVVSTDMLSRLNDRYYGQWMSLNVPFERF